MQASSQYGSHVSGNGGSGIPRYVVFGCLSLLIVLVIGGIIGAVLLKSAFTHVVDTFTSDKPLVVAEVRLDHTELADLKLRIRQFADGLSDGSASQPLVLTANEINALVQDHLRSSNAPVAAEVRILGRQFEGEVSIPLEGRDWPLAGRYLNGKAVFSVGVVDGRAAAYIKDLRVGDRYIPDLVREEISKENLLREVYKEDSDLSRALMRIRSMQINDGKVILSPVL